MTSFVRSPGEIERLVVYLDGDAPAWHRDRVRVLAEPPPIEPLALELAALDPAPAVAWLGRPCQPVEPEDSAACEPSLWSHRRFSEPVVAALDAGLEALLERTGARHIELVGYSGGGVLAALLAARREDVQRLVTIAAPLDLAAWRAHHGLGALEASDPARIPSPRLETLPQVHLLGERDEIVPPGLLEGYRERRSAARVEIVRGRRHGPWSEGWADRIRSIRSGSP